TRCGRRADVGRVLLERARGEVRARENEPAEMRAGRVDRVERDGRAGADDARRRTRAVMRRKHAEPSVDAQTRGLQVSAAHTELLSCDRREPRLDIEALAHGGGETPAELG